MGFYIETPAPLRKAEQIIAIYNGLPVLPYPELYADARANGEVPIVVVSNGAFDAAAIAYSQREYDEFMNDPSDRRPKRVVLLREAQVRELSPHCPIDGR